MGACNEFTFRISFSTPPSDAWQRVPAHLGVVGSYARMALKVADYNSLQHEAQVLRDRYDNLQKKVNQTNQQLASLQVLAEEVGNAYGMKKQLAGSPDSSPRPRSSPRSAKPSRNTATSEPLTSPAEPATSLHAPMPTCSCGLAHQRTPDGRLWPPQRPVLR